jgi:hypothetical protein
LFIKIEIKKRGLERSGFGLKEGSEAAMLLVCVENDGAQTT